MIREKATRKRNTFGMLLFLMLLFLLSGTAKTAYAANHVTEIDIAVVIREDGSALVTQVWSGEFENGTENYIPIRTGDIAISEFAVADENGAYLLVSDWDVDADFTTKQGKCGIVTTDDGVELCFGITEYGHKEYTISYVVSDFIKGYTDYNGTNFMFINPEMSTFPTAGSVTLSLESGVPLDSSNAGIWAFGFEGMAEFADGCAVAYTQEDLTGDGYMVVMLQLDLSLLSPETVLEESFETVKNTAFEGSSYNYSKEAFMKELKRELKLVGLVLLLLFLACMIPIGLTILILVNRDKEMEKFRSTVDYFKDIPNQGNLELTCYLVKTFDISNREQILRALMVSMMNQGSIEFGKAGTLNDSGKDTETLYLLVEPESASEKLLFRFLSDAAGKDGIMDKLQLDEYVFDHYTKLTNILDTARKNGKKIMKQQGGFKRNRGSRIRHLNERGQTELAEVLGLKKYLEEKAGMGEHGIPDSTLWRRYMVYAALFDIDSLVLEELEKLYPEYSRELKSYQHHEQICHTYCHRMNYSIRKAVKASGGGGGSSSRHGGGGHSGGGHGGGSR